MVVLLIVVAMFELVVLELTMFAVLESLEGKELEVQVEDISKLDAKCSLVTELSIHFLLLLKGMT